MEYLISKNDLTSIEFDEETNQLTLNWNSLNGVCGLVLKVELVEKIESTYKYPKVDYDQDYNNPF